MNQLPAPYSSLVTQAAQPTTLLENPRYGPAGHRWSDNEVAAVVQAWASQRPLLVRGEAGCGKSQLARAVAQVLGLDLITEVIHPRYEATDLLYREDPVERLAQAQLLGTLAPPTSTDAIDATDATTRLQWLKAQLLPEHFIRYGPLHRAMTCADPVGPGREHPAWPRAVVLIDEIDKADSDLPNALLDVLGNRSFQVQPTGETVQCTGQHRPLILITTNEDRELPPAFVRRCAVLNLRPDDDTADHFARWLTERAQAHPELAPLTQNAALMKSAAAQVWADRVEAKRLHLPTVGLAEFLDLLYSLWRLSQGQAARAAALLNQLSAYALVKHRDQDQARTPHDGPRQSI